MIASILASVLAVSAIQDTVTRLPGATVHFGAASSHFGAAQGFQSSPQGPNERLSERTGTMRFFGIDALATLQFLDRRLVEAEFVIESASPRQISYIEDDLRRRGYRRECTVLERESSRCVWRGAAHVELTRDGARISAIVRPLTLDPRQAEPAAPAMTVHPDTLTIPRDSVAAYVKLVVEPRYPDAAREAAVMGVVRLLALVDTAGIVREVQVVHSISELDQAAVEAMWQWRFIPFLVEERPVARWVIVPLIFTVF